MLQGCQLRIKESFNQRDVPHNPALLFGVFFGPPTVVSIPTIKQIFSHFSCPG